MRSRDRPKLFRILLPAKDLDLAGRFYESLLGIRARRVAEGRLYFRLGSAILGVLDYSNLSAGALRPSSESVYLTVRDLEPIYRRAKQLRCLSKELLHGDPKSPLGRMVVRPWGERSFYVEDPSGNSLCFVEESTKFTGTPRQIAALSRARSGRGRR